MQQFQTVKGANQMNSGLRVAMFVVGSSCLSACLTVVYQPLSALRQPVGIDVRKANFEGMTIHLKCFSGALLQPEDADNLCRNVSEALERQSAKVQLDQPNEEDSTADDTGKSEGETPPVAKPAGAQTGLPSSKLIVELSAKRVRILRNGWLGPLSFYTLTLVPQIEDFTDEQRIVVRDESGFVLADQSFQLRFIEYTGFGYLALNTIANFLFRSEEEQIVEGTADRLMTRDLHRQLSQVVMNAGTRQLALKLAKNPSEGGN